MACKEAGFVRVGHGKEASVRKLQTDDYLIFYLPKLLQNETSSSIYSSCKNNRERYLSSSH